MAILYQGSQFFKGNKFIDPKGSKLIFEKNTKKGKIFVTDKGNKIGLTEGQVNRLKLINESNIVRTEDKNIPVVNGILLTYGLIEEKLLISSKSLISINTFATDNIMRGYLYVDIEKVELGKFKLDYLLNENLIDKIEVIMDDITSDIYDILWSSTFSKVKDNSYIIIFEGEKVK